MARGARTLGTGRKKPAYRTKTLSAITRTDDKRKTPGDMTKTPDAGQQTLNSKALKTKNPKQQQLSFGI
jgi:hypothetical protein